MLSARHVSPCRWQGLFFAGDTYIVRYSYKNKGREQHVLYHWHGRLASPDEKGAAALLVKELDDKELDGNAAQVPRRSGQV